jgi:hypothetical protein
MVNIYFQRLKYNDTFQSNFIGDNCVNIQDYQIGDEVSILLDCNEEIAANIRNLPSNSDVIVTGDAPLYEAFIRCTVVKRSHALILEKGITMKQLTHNICLQATSGYGEDVLLWLFYGQVPTWAEVEGQ